MGKIFLWVILKLPIPVFKRLLRWTLCTLGMCTLAAPAWGQSTSVLEAREAMRKKDRARLAALRVQAVEEKQSLALWVDYWELSARIQTAAIDEIEDFYKRWPGTYVEDRLRNDWLLELGRRRDWRPLTLDYPRFRMNDDREVTCYALLADHQMGKDVRVAAKAAWLAQKEADDGCVVLATALYEARQLTSVDAWRRARLGIDSNRAKASRQALLLVGPVAVNAFDDMQANPMRFLLRNQNSPDRPTQEIATLALMKLAANDFETSANQLATWEALLPAELAAWAWAATGKQAALKLHGAAQGYFEKAMQLSAKAGAKIDWSDEMLAWNARAQLRGGDSGVPRWARVAQAIDAMSPAEQRESTWVYWKGRALQDAGQSLLASIAGQYHFYGTLAAEELGQPLALPVPPAALTPQERAGAAQNPGLVRALQLLDLGLRSEGNREWNFSLRDMDDRALLAAAQLGCERALWDRCINTSERTKTQIDMGQRFPTPHRPAMLDNAQSAGLDAAYVYGLIRQESRFIVDARSGVGASGLMQLMPATARWTAKKIGFTYAPHMIAELETNLKLGTNYLKFVLDDLDGSQAMAAAAYNAGPNRPRKWRDGPKIEPAIWTENIPFGETRDYVKKVLSNAVIYAALLSGEIPKNLPTLKARLGKSIGPREPQLPAPDMQLP
jgi:soluble lytic murein transglycosylase